MHTGGAFRAVAVGSRAAICALALAMAVLVVLAGAFRAVAVRGRAAINAVL